MPESCQRSVQELSKMLEVSGKAVGQTPLEAGPDKFIRVELRRISGEVKGLDPMTSSKELLDELGPVEGAPVPEKDERAFLVTPKVSEELADLFGPDVPVGIKACVESEPFPLGRDGNGGDGRDFTPASCDRKRRSSALTRPGPLEVGDKRESALIEEYEAGPDLLRLFLYGARSGASSDEWPVPSAPWLSSWASGSSSPGRPSDSRDLRCNRSPGSSCERLGQYASRSRRRSDSPLPRGLSPRDAPSLSSVPLTDAESGPDGAWASDPPGLSLGRLDANGRGSLSKRSVPWRPNRTGGPVSKAVRRGAAFVPAAGVCREVSSYPPGLPLYDRLEMASIEW